MSRGYGVGQSYYANQKKLAESDLILPVRREVMKKELGFESDSDDDVPTSGAQRRGGDTVPLRKYMELDELFKEEVKRGQETMSKLQLLEQRLAKSDDSLQAFKATTKSTLGIMKKQYEEDVKRREEAVQELKAALEALEKDPACVTALEDIFHHVSKISATAAAAQVGTRADAFDLQGRNHDLERRVQELTDELQFVRQEAKRALEGGRPSAGGSAGPSALTDSGSEERAELTKQLQDARKQLRDAQRELESLRAGAGAPSAGAGLSDKERKALEAERGQLQAEVERLNAVLREKDASITERLQQAASSTSGASQALLAEKEKQWLEEKARLVAEYEKKMKDSLKAKDKEAKEEKLRLKDKVENLLKKREEETERWRAEAERAGEQERVLQERVAQLQDSGRMQQLTRVKQLARDIRKNQRSLRKEAAEFAMPSLFNQFSAAMRKLLEASNEANTRYQKELKERRKLYNQLVELKGNIRVFARVRPLLKEEAARGEAACVEITDEQELTVDGPSGKKAFEFDRVYGLGTTQAQVFEDTKPLVTSVLDGFNVCIFAYGQTGSGKTYTMEGPEHDRGVNYRAIRELFNLALVEHATSFDYEINLSLLEIYNEIVQDLLVDPKEQKKLEVRMSQGGSYVEGLVRVPVRGEKDVSQWMEAASRNRRTAQTAMNTDSSRSHLVLTVYVEGTSKATGMRTTGKLNLIDLAGSERISKSLAAGDRLKEAQAINKSLSALGNVIAALAGKNSHVPYRDSKLTMVLQDSLSGDSKMLMFVQIRPSFEHQSETMCSLNFAMRARSVELGQAKRHLDAINPRRSPSPGDEGAPVAASGRPPRPGSAQR
eukprot:tig00000241_g20914.t1